MFDFENKLNSSDIKTKFWTTFFAFAGFGQNSIENYIPAHFEKRKAFNSKRNIGNGNFFIPTKISVLFCSNIKFKKI